MKFEDIGNFIEDLFSRPQSAPVEEDITTWDAPSGKPAPAPPADNSTPGEYYWREPTDEESRPRNAVTTVAPRKSNFWENVRLTIILVLFLMCLCSGMLAYDAIP